jgi:hypothetical protein
MYNSSTPDLTSLTDDAFLPFLRLISSTQRIDPTQVRLLARHLLETRSLSSMTLEQSTCSAADQDFDAWAPFRTRLQNQQAPPTEV